MEDPGLDLRVGGPVGPSFVRGRAHAHSLWVHRRSTRPHTHTHIHRSTRRPEIGITPSPVNRRDQPYSTFLSGNTNRGSLLHRPDWTRRRLGLLAWNGGPRRPRRDGPVDTETHETREGPRSLPLPRNPPKNESRVPRLVGLQCPLGRTSGKDNTDKNVQSGVPTGRSSHGRVH